MMGRPTALQIAFAAFIAALEGWRHLLGPRVWEVFVDMAVRRLEAERRGPQVVRWLENVDR